MTSRGMVRLLSCGLVLALGLPAWSEEPEAKKESDKKEGETSGSVTVGGQAGSGIDDSSKLQQYETVPKGVFLESSFFKWKKGDYSFDFTGTKLGLEDQFAAVGFGKKGSFNLSGVWDQNPNWMSNAARTPFTETSPGVFHAPDGMRKALQDVYVPWVPPSSSNPIGTGSAPANPTVPGYFAVESWVNESFPTDLKYVRKNGKTELDLKSGENLAFKVSYAHEARSGNKNTTFAAGSPDIEVATPIDYRTDTIRAEAEYAKGKKFLSAAFDYSNFQNDIPYNTIDNPERLELQSPTSGRFITNDVTTFRLWQPPSNDAFNVDLTGGLSFGKRQKLTAAFSTGQMKMSHELLPLSTNPYLATSTTTPDARFTLTPPYDSVSARFDPLMVSLRFTGDPSSKFGYIASYRKFKLTDKTDPYTFNSFARGDTNASYKDPGITREHEGWSVQSLKAEVHVLPAKGLRLGASYGEDKREYDRREYSDVTDKNIALSADYNRDKLAFHGAWTVLDRNPGGSGAGSPPSWDGATQTDISQRNRHMLSGMLTVMPSEKLAVSLTGQKQQNEFSESVTGLLDQTSQSFGADVTFAQSAKFNAWAGYVYEKYFVSMAAAYIGKSSPYDPANLWINDTTDRIDTYRVGFNAVPNPDKWDIVGSLDYSKPRSDSIYNFTLPNTPIGGLNEANGIFPANVPPIPGFPPYSYDRFPQVSKNFLILKLTFNYHIQKNMLLSVLYWKQKFDNVDWQTNNPGVNGEPFTPYMGRVDPGANRWFFLGAQVPSYDANIFRASLTYRF